MKEECNDCEYLKEIRTDFKGYPVKICLLNHYSHECNINCPDYDNDDIAEEEELEDGEDEDE